MAAVDFAQQLLPFSECFLQKVDLLTKRIYLTPDFSNV